MEGNGGKLDLAQLRNLVRRYIDDHLYNTALFWADKTCSLSNWNQQDIIWLAQTMFLTSQFRRAADLLEKRGLVHKNLVAKYLVAKCYAECKDWDKVLEILEHDQLDVSTTSEDNSEMSRLENSVAGGGRKIESAIALLKGMAYEGSGNSVQHLAADAFKEALKLDVFCFEAFDLLTSHNMLSSNEENELIESLPFDTQCSKEESELVKFLYESRVKHYCKPIDPKLSTNLENLNENLDIIVSMSIKHFNNCDVKACYKLTSAVLSHDEFHEACIPIHISCLVELQKKNELYHIASTLVNNYPKKAISWHAVGAYYLITGKNEAARRYFGKATSINRVYAPAWLGFAHSYANESEHDQAISAYFTASELMPGSHFPYLYLGMEHVITNNIKLAKHFFKEALVIAPGDPFVKHELGTVAYHMGNYKVAKKYFKDALQRVEMTNEHVISEHWEPLFNNLGHACRQLGEYENSLHYHKTALSICPNNASTYSAIGLVHCYLKNFKEAVDAFHNALSICRDDTVSQELLVYSLNAFSKSLLLVEEEGSYEGADTDDKIDAVDVTNDSSTMEMEDTSMIIEE
eukprot:gene8062-8925_t